MKDGVWFEPIKTFSRRKCGGRWTQEENNGARHWVVHGAATQDVVSRYSSVHSNVCKLFGGLAAEKHRLHRCKKLG